ncbi:GNAT family N-acetyltransferase [Rothia uropygialis]|uniref:GNAT family N-acetyltransferase n=1 Tax=Kocuria sp. 36 TaxID=1415402 RepID=UPI00101C503F|nr:GNAT family N-acetyltransferase [Kocuria sp. 36]
MKFLTQRADRISGPTVRPLTVDDTESLLGLINQSPVANLFPLEHYERIGLPRPSFLTRMHSASPFLGVFEPSEEMGRTELSELTGAVWFGANLVPIRLERHHFSRVADYILRTHKKPASLFGPAEFVMPLWELIRGGLPRPFDIRPQQPLMSLVDHETARRVAHRETTTGLSPVRWAVPSDLEELLPASVSMFTEEVGYSPMEHNPEGYSQRVLETVRSGRTVVATDTRGKVIFKTDLGLAAQDMCQLQGVWLAPRLRGQGLSESFMAQACELIAPRFPRISLYVNDYNGPARALYRAVGFQQVGTFSTILM